MSGYRQSSFDPNAYSQAGRPMRPFNWVQWTGVGLEVVGLGLFLLFLAGKLGWFPRLADIPPISGTTLMLIGIALINSRRHPYIDLAPELAPARKRLLIITVAICAAALGAAAVIQFSGA